MSKELNLLHLFIIVLKYYKFFIVNFIFICIVAVIFSFCLTKQYKSELVFIPKTSSSNSGLFALIGNSFGGDLMGSDQLSKRQYAALLESRELREELIKKFDLINVFKCNNNINPTDLALKILQKKIRIKISEEGGLGITDVIQVSITVIDKDPKLASEIANYLYTLLQAKVISLNKTECSTIKSFFETQIVNCEKKLTESRKALKVFQDKNKAYNISEQAALSMQVIAANKAELISIENELAYKKNLYSNSYGTISMLTERKNALYKKLTEMELSQKTDIFTGLSKSVDLAYQFSDLYKEVETYMQLDIILRQQYEQTKIRELKNYLPLYLIDSARPAEYKFKPKRSIVIISIISLYMAIVFFFTFLYHQLKIIKKNNPDQIKNFLQLIHE